MKYIIGIDGGGTKTHLGVFDTAGNLKYEKLGKGSNHAASDGKHFDRIIRDLFETALEHLAIVINDIEYVYLGLSGADLDSDFIKLNTILRDIFKPIPFTVVNDAWIMLRSGLSTPYGAVAISGTGTNSAAMSSHENKAILRSLGFMLGIYGGGLDIAREGMHYAFRYDELTYKPTCLKHDILNYFNVKNMEEVVKYFYPSMKITKQQYGDLAGLVFDAAKKHDEVANEILSRMGVFIAEQTLGVMKQVDITKGEVPIVMGGRVFKDQTTALVKTFKDRILESTPLATFITPQFKPFVGAYLSALDLLDIQQTDTIEQNLKESGCYL